MAWAVPQYSREDVNRAGDLLMANEDVVWITSRDQMLSTINN